jgi:3-methyladenine DNA glycosylase/8-oxoguanine DNA glycosylase
VERLQSLGLTGARARTVRDFARAYSEERVRLDPGASLEEVVGPLEALPGVGPWTAQMIALRAAGQRDAFAPGDLGLRRAVGRLTGVDGPVDAAEVERVAEAWRPDRALAAMHLWMSR